jgi:hypothetical protein
MRPIGEHDHGRIDAGKPDRLAVEEKAVGGLNEKPARTLSDGIPNFNRICRGEFGERNVTRTIAAA